MADIAEKDFEVSILEINKNQNSDKRYSQTKFHHFE